MKNTYYMSIYYNIVLDGDRRILVKNFDPCNLIHIGRSYIRAQLEWFWKEMKANQAMVSKENNREVIWNFKKCVENPRHRIEFMNSFTVKTYLQQHLNQPKYHISKPPKDMSYCITDNNIIERSDQKYIYNLFQHLIQTKSWIITQVTQPHEYCRYSLYNVSIIQSKLVESWAEVLPFSIFFWMNVVYVSHCIDIDFPILVSFLPTPSSVFLHAK